MLRLILTKDWVSGRKEILSRIAQDVEQEQSGRILIVPELISHDTERRLCKAAGDTASRFAEVLSFPRLASRVAEYVGGEKNECLDNGGRIVAMAAATRQLHSRLKVYAAVETKPEFLKELVDTVDEMKRCCISAADLKAASEKTTGTLAQKLEELSLVLEAYDALCAQGRRDPRDRMTWCLEQLEDSNFASEHVFYIDGFPDFTRQHLAILEHLIRESPMVTVCLNCDSVQSKALAFEKAGDTASQLYRCGKNAGVAVEIQYLEPRNHALQDLCEGLFQGSMPTQEQLSGCITAAFADSVHNEIHGAAQQVLKLVQQGCRYRDISIVCADMGAYEDSLEMIFARYGIPVYRSGTEDILQKTVISTVLAAMDAALGGFEQRDVLRYIKSILSPLEIDACDKLENYVITWGIRGNSFLKEWAWHPEGISFDFDEKSTKKLEQINDARKIAIEPLQSLYNGFKQAKNLAEQIKTLYAFLEEISLAARLQQLAEELDKSGQKRDAQILNQLWEILLSALEQMYDTLGQTVWEPEIFIRLFTLLLAQYTVGTIPPVLDAVMVGPVSAMRCQEEKHLLVLGAEEGLLPGYGGSQGLLTDQERVTLRQMGVPLTGGSVEGLQAEFAEIFGVFCGAMQSVYISHAGAEASYVYRRIAKASGGEKKIESIGLSGTQPREIGAYLSRWQEKALAEEMGVSDFYQEAKNRTDYRLGNISTQSVQKLYGNNLSLSASQVDRYHECRMSYFLKYGLRAKERKEYTVDPAEFGTYVHDVLEHTAAEVMERGGFDTVSMEDTLEIAKKYSDNYAAARFSQLDSSRLTYLFHRNWRELEMVVQELWNELKESLFRPAAFELSFGRDGQMPPIAVDNPHIPTSLRGFVDRVDIWEKNGKHYFRVVDYKTGKKDFDYCDVFNGVGLQMLLYLFALEQNGESIVGEQPVASGVQYFPARVPLVTADGRLTKEEADKARQKEWVRKGLLVADEEILHAMEPDDEMTRLCCTRKKDGALSGDLADGKQLKDLRKFVFQLLQNMVGEMASGNIEANPYTRGSSHNACTYCPYGSICHAGEVEGRRNYKTMTAQRFWEEVDREVNGHG